MDASLAYLARELFVWANAVRPRLVNLGATVAPLHLDVAQVTVPPFQGLPKQKISHISGARKASI